MKSIIFLKPFFKEMIWGGSRLGTDFGYDIPGDGEGDINGQNIKKDDYFILPTGFGEVKISGRIEIIASAV